MRNRKRFYSTSLGYIYATYAFIPAIKKKKLENLVIVSPDKGGVPRATFYQGLLKTSEMAIVYKERDISANNKSEARAMVGDVRGKNALMLMINWRWRNSCSCGESPKGKGSKKESSLAQRTGFSPETL